MSIIQAAGSGEVSTGFYTTTIDQSLKFDAGSSAYLTRTNSGAASSATLTVVSCWVKRGKLGSIQMIFSSQTSDPNACGYVSFMADDTLQVYLDKTAAGSDELVITTTSVFRDVSSWYHIVVVFNAAESANADKMKIYVNGVQQAIGTPSVTGNAVTAQRLLADGVNLTISKYFNDNYYLGGYLAEYHVVDGVAGIDHDDFGELKSGVWVPKSYSGGHGNNGFYLPFSFTEGNSVEFDGTGDNISWVNATQYDIATDDDFCLEFFMKADIEANWAYGFGDYTNSNWVLQLGPNGIPYLYYPGGSITFSDMSAYITTTDWHHIALVRESGTHRFYVDGVQRSTSTSFGTTAVNMAHFDVGDAHEAGGASHLNGTYSNLRFTIGAARYGSGTTFTVPTSTLTNDSSNVKLLAFTTSTITADASTAAVSGSITEGAPRFSPDNPFSVTLGNDTSGNNNDFTSSVLVYSDVVPDSPTNNFATFNELEKHSSSVLSEGSLVATSAAANTWECIGSTMHVSSGKWYCEVLMTGATGTLDLIIGVARSQSFKFLAGTTFYTPSSNFGYYASVGDIYSGGSLTGDFNITYGVGDIIGIAIDMDNLAVYFAKNNTYINSGNPASGSSKTGLSGALLAGASYQVAVGAYQNNVKFAVNFGQDSSFSLHTNAGSAFASDANGIGDFFYAPPSGYLAMCSSNLPEPEIIDGTDYFNTITYTGNSSQLNVTGVGFSPDWTWIKKRTTANHVAQDSVRGSFRYLVPGAASTGAQSPENTISGNDWFRSFDSDGFTVSATTTGGSATSEWNDNGATYVSWNWLAGTAFSNSAGANGASIASSGQVNTKAGFSIVSYTGSGANATVAHGLGVAPSMVIIKSRVATSADGNWLVYVKAGSVDETDYLLLNSTAAQDDAAGAFNDTAATTTTFSLGTFADLNDSTKTYIAYCFANVEGYSKVGSYFGNSNADGTFVYTGHRPQFLLIKRTDAAGTNWWIWDNKRTPFNLADDAILVNDGAAEYTDNSSLAIDILSNGFKMRNTYADLNVTGSPSSYIFISIAESPFKFANAR